MSAAAATADAPAFCTQAEFARLNDWSKSYVTKLKGEGRLVMADDGRVDVRASLAKIGGSTTAPERASAPVVGSVLQDLQAAEKRLDIQRKEREERQAMGELLDRADVLEVVADAGTLFRGRLESWPDRLAPQIAALAGDEARIRALLAEHIEGALNEISQRFTTLAGHTRGQQT